MKYHFDIKQNSEEWDAIRLGRETASVGNDVLMDIKCKGFTDLVAKNFEERRTGKRCESKKFMGNSFTDRGHEFEPVAILDFEMKTFNDVIPVGFVSIGEHFGCSPDGLIDANGLLQIKCPIFNTQYEYLEEIEKLKNKDLTDNEILYKLSSSYYKQMQFELFVCSDREYNIFYSYHPSLPEILLKIERDETMISNIESKLEIIEEMIQERIIKLKAV